MWVIRRALPSWNRTAVWDGRYTSRWVGVASGRSGRMVRACSIFVHRSGVTFPVTSSPVRPGPSVRDSAVGAATALVGAAGGAVVSTTGLLEAVGEAPPPWLAAMLAQAATPRTIAAAAKGNHRLTVIASDSYPVLLAPPQRPAGGPGTSCDATKTGRGRLSALGGHGGLHRPLGGPELGPDGTHLAQDLHDHRRRRQRRHAAGPREVVDPELDHLPAL